MSNYNQIKKLDEESAAQLKEGTGPIDECICGILAPPDGEKGRLSAMGASIKKAFNSLSGGKRNRTPQNDAKGAKASGQRSIDIPLTFTRGGKGIFTTKEVVKRNTSCGKCGCDKEKFVMKHSHANIRIISPDISNICPCPTDCLPDKTKLQNNITVTVERLEIEPDLPDSELSIHGLPAVSELPAISDLRAVSESLTTELLGKRSITELTDDQFKDINF